MVTLVGTQSDFKKALKELLELEYDAKETYVAAIDRLESKEYKDKLSSFKDDHEQHIKALTEYLEKIGEEVPHGPSGKQVLLIGRVAISNLIGDKAILNAMRAAEEDTNTAYERMNNHADKDANLADFLTKALGDERRHKEWFVSINA
jgi:rubrerythrin